MEGTLSVGELARRSGVAASALRFYETCGLISSRRTGGGQRRYDRGTLRRVAVIRAAQAVGLSLDEIRSALEGLPARRTPNAEDWERLSEEWHRKLEQRIAELERLRDNLGGCIGCGCLSLSHCGLLNPGDRAGRDGPGARYLRVPEPSS